ncbi:Protein bassoon [Takifugu flavidus]|uniref:Protein bassoon n=1 Tax=Takifugu flavidus TaxID=433684 RepID=A0A5C6N4N4_9TELE|nr:Protein bassoon [Takifugu flavidus]
MTPIIWAKKRLTGLRSHERPVLIVQNIMEVEVIHPQVGGVNTLTMITTNLRRNIVLVMSTASNATHPPRHHGNTVTMGAALADTALHVTPQRTPGPLGLPGHILKTKLLGVTAEAPRHCKEEAVPNHVLPRQVQETQVISLENQTLVVTMVLEDGARDPREIEQLEGRIPLQLGLNNSSSHLRVIAGSSVQVVRGILGDIQVQSHLMHLSRPNSSINRTHIRSNAAKHHHTASLHRPPPPPPRLDQHSSSSSSSSSPNLARNHQVSQRDSQPLQM